MSGLPSLWLCPLADTRIGFSVLIPLAFSVALPHTRPFPSGLGRLVTISPSRRFRSQLVSVDLPLLPSVGSLALTGRPYVQVDFLWSLCSPSSGINLSSRPPRPFDVFA